MGLRTTVYVDAFNLYYGALKDTPHRWLDLRALFQLLLPDHEVERIRYFTARVRDRKENPGRSQRQQLYLRALQTHPEISVFYGQFRRNLVSLPLAEPDGGPGRRVRVFQEQEKGSDVHLATRLLTDSFRGLLECAVIVSNDSDLLPPVAVVREEIGVPVGILNPLRRPSHVLLNKASFFKQIRPKALGLCQFPERLQDQRGEFYKPPDW